MEIKPCSHEDLDTLVDISIQSYREHYAHLWFDNGDQYVADNFNLKAFDAQLRDSNVALFLILAEGRPVGFLKLNIDKAYATFGARLSLELERVYLVRRATGKGLGTRILDFVADFARARNKRYVWLNAMAASPAFQFYRASGYSVSGHWRLTLPQLKDESGEMHVMVKEV